MSRHSGQLAYALCDYRDQDDRRCRAFVIPDPCHDPMAGGAVLASYLDCTLALSAAEWGSGPGGDWCPAHKGARAEVS